MFFHTFRLFCAFVICLFLSSCEEAALKGLAFTNVNILDVETGHIREQQTVIISNSRIELIGNSDDVAVDNVETVIDGKGKFLVPGLMDMHTHVSKEKDMLLYVANGVTTIRNMWGEKSLLDLREQIQSGQLLGPRIYTSGRIVDGKPGFIFGSEQIADPADIAQVIRHQKQQGFDFIKVYSNISPDMFYTIDREAEKVGIEFSGHVPIAVSFEEALSTNMLTFEHLHELLPAVIKEGAPNPDKAFFDPRQRQMLAAIGASEEAAWQIIDEQKLERFANQFARSGKWLVPTFEVLKMFTSDGPNRHPHADKYISLAMRNAWQMGRTRILSLPENELKGHNKVYQLKLRLMENMKKAGSRAMVGTDAPNPGVYIGFSVVDEIKNFVDAGYSPLEAIQAATIEPAKYLNLHSSVGNVREGMKADVLLVCGNPLENLDFLRHPLNVVVDGKHYSRSALAAMLNDIAKNIQANENLLVSEPVVPEGDIGASYFRTQEGELTRTSFNISKDGETTINFSKRVDGIWSHAAFIQSSDYQIIKIKGKEVARLQRQDAGWRLTSNEDSISLDVSGPMTFVTNNIIDIQLINNVFSSLSTNEEARIFLWSCPSLDDCGAGDLTSVVVKPKGKITVDTYYSYAGSFEFHLEGEFMNESFGKYWIGGGFHTLGQLLKYTFNNEEIWTRFK